MESVEGVTVRMACNHWDLAIQTHNYNFPHVDHDRQDIAEIDPRRYPSTDILWASPACTFWSQAAGRKVDFDTRATEPGLFDLTDLSDLNDEPEDIEAKERSRALMKDVPRFAEYHRYRAVIVENTPPLLKWWYFPQWIARMRNLGYRHKVLTLNSAFAHQLGAPAPQLRDRVYVVFWQERYPEPDFERWTRPQAWCPDCGEVVTALRAPKDPAKPHGAYGAQYVFRCPRITCRHGIVHPYTLPALSIIDWTNPGIRIGDRARHGLPPLKPKTYQRIAASLRRFGRPVTVEAAGNTFERRPGARAWPADEPLKTLHTTQSKALACPPLLMPMEGREGKYGRLAAHPMRAQTGRHETGLLVPTGGTWNESATALSAPMRTRTTRESEAVVLVPLRANNRPKSGREPLDTFAASGNHHGLLLRNNGSRGDGSEMATLLDEPARTITTAGHQSLMWNPEVLFAYDAAYYRELTKPLPTQTTVAGDAVLQTDLNVEDCLFRMLDVQEVKGGMGFEYGFVLLGTSNRNKVRMCGNAVTPPVSRDLMACVVEAITGDTPVTRAA
ncbi:DNA cytosine methyltransferase [Prauserella sp. PE36]|nr:DNA cytosine methyltransferase [Prauserella sp. PE36]